MRQHHSINPSFMESSAEIIVVGAGGNGAQMVNALGRLHLALIALGRDTGLGHVRVYDDDDVSDANVGRQLWSPSDVGQNKAVTVVNRLNAYLGLGWDGIPERFGEGTLNEMRDRKPRMLIGCIDSRPGRRLLHEWATSGSNLDYYCDLGNENRSGQVVLGEPIGTRRYTAETPRLPMVAELFPELLDGSVKETTTHSCSRRISLQSQGLFVNDMAVRCAAQLIYMLFTKGRITSHGAVFDIEAFRMQPIEIKTSGWERFGYVAEAHSDP